MSLIEYALSGVVIALIMFIVGAIIVLGGMFFASTSILTNSEKGQGSGLKIAIFGQILLILGIFLGIASFVALLFL